MTDVGRYLRGSIWPATDGVAYPRVDPTDARRLPLDTWSAAQTPAGVRLEFDGDATHIEIDYTTATGELGYRGTGAGVNFEVWRGGDCVDAQPAVLGRGTVRLNMGSGDGRVTVYLPEGMKPQIHDITAVGGEIVPVPAGPRWIAYGDSITEGWSASSPARCWVAVVGRELVMDTVNLGYAGAARGELALAQQIAALDADVITIAYGTNCWATIPHSADMIRANTAAFLEIVRAAHPRVPLLVISPLIRPAAEDQPNVLGATLTDIRDAIERAVAERDDRLITLRPGRNLVPASVLVDGVHPGDEGHRLLARRIGDELRLLRRCSA